MAAAAVTGSTITWLILFRREDKTIRDFTIPNQEGIGGQIIEINSVQVIRNHQAEEKEVNITLLFGWKVCRFSG